MWCPPKTRFGAGVAGCPIVTLTEITVELCRRLTTKSASTCPAPMRKLKTTWNALCRMCMSKRRMPRLWYNRVCKSCVIGKLVILKNYPVGCEITTFCTLDIDLNYRVLQNALDPFLEFILKRVTFGLISLDLSPLSLPPLCST